MTQSFFSNVHLPGWVHKIHSKALNYNLLRRATMTNPGNKLWSIAYLMRDNTVQGRVCLRQDKAYHANSHMVFLYAFVSTTVCMSDWFTSILQRCCWIIRAGPVFLFCLFFLRGRFVLHARAHTHTLSLSSGYSLHPTHSTPDKAGMSHNEKHHRIMSVCVCLCVRECATAGKYLQYNTKIIIQKLFNGQTHTYSQNVTFSKWRAIHLSDTVLVM